MSDQTHVHKYRRVYLDKAKTVLVWRCVKPNCPHYIRREFLTGRMSECWRCGSEFELKAPNTRQAKPTCCKKIDPIKAVEQITKEESFESFLKKVGLHGR